VTKRVLITGGASGLGKALAHRFIRDGHRVLVTDIHTERGEEVARELGRLGDVSFLRADTTQDADWERVREWVETHFHGLDILVNNAGVGAAGRIDRISMEDWDWIIDINLKGVIRGCRTFVPMFKRQRSGHILNIASLAALVNPPSMNSYNVTKSAVVSLSETLRSELAPYGIRTSVACPSFFETNLAENLRTQEAILAQTAKKLISGGRLSADQVADRIVRAVEKGRFLVLPHPEGKAVYLLKRFSPYVLYLGVRQAAFKLERALDRAP